MTMAETGIFTSGFIIGGIFVFLIYTAYILYGVKDTKND